MEQDELWVPPTQSMLGFWDLNPSSVLMLIFSQAQGTQEEAGAAGDPGASRAAPYQEHGDQGVETLHKR